MADTTAPSRNWAPLLALLLALAALLSNLAFFVRPPGERAIPLLSLALAAMALVVLVVGIRKAFAQNRGKILSSVLGVLALLACGLAGFVYFEARQLPKSAGAPQVGQKAPDFTLTDSTGKQVSLAQLLTQSATVMPAAGTSPVNAQAAMTSPGGGAKPKAVLLIFYRGYW